MAMNQILGKAIKTPANAGSGQASEADSAFEGSTLDFTDDPVVKLSRVVPRRRALVGLALLGCLGIFFLARWLAGTLYLDGEWAAMPRGNLTLQASADDALAAAAGGTLVALATPGQPPVRVDSTLLHRSPRWQIDDPLRQAQVDQNRALSEALSRGTVWLDFADKGVYAAPAVPRGFGGLGWLFWILAGAALLLYLASCVVALARLTAPNLLYLVMTMCQAGNLLVIATETLPGLGLPTGLLHLDLPLRAALDACTGAAIVHVFALFPTRLPQARRVGVAVWFISLLWVAAATGGWLRPAWWWVQALLVTLGLAALFLARLSYRTEANPFALVMQRFAVISLATLVLLSWAVALTSPMPDLSHDVAVGASITWYLFMASLLVLAPFLSGRRRVLREFALLAGASTVAASLDLVFVSLFDVGPLVSLAIALSLAMLLYAGARQFFLARLLGNQRLSTERIFDHLYRSARALQAAPERHTEFLAQLLHDLFDPIKMQRVSQVPTRARVINGGAALLVPVRGASAERSMAMTGARPGKKAEGPHGHALLMRFALRGQRLFTVDDARLADGMAEQLRRAVAYDQAVERGRTEERQRIAQDLHDDIGARLLTLMYQSPTPEMEDYIRHTLQDLKTLTRGLAAPGHTLSHAAAEWKADLTQRLSAARADLVWSTRLDHDRQLSVVQWSALTRMLRELVSNALFHGHATRVDVSLVLKAQHLLLRVADDGAGRQPQTWSHGLGLGGVRKRVKALGGRVHWSEAPAGGIVCEIEVHGFAAPAAGHDPA